MRIQPFKVVNVLDAGAEQVTDDKYGLDAWSMWFP